MKDSWVNIIAGLPIAKKGGNNRKSRSLYKSHKKYERVASDKKEAKSGKRLNSTTQQKTNVNKGGKSNLVSTAGEAGDEVNETIKRLNTEKAREVRNAKPKKIVEEVKESPDKKEENKQPFKQQFDENINERMEMRIYTLLYP
jgi:hypothetical protein